LINDILSRAKSAAYAHGAKYLARLNELAVASDAAAVPDMSRHATFTAELAKAHGRKTSFWSQVRATG
jgi:hypothetical protein